MEDIAPPLKFIVFLKMHIEQGNSVNSAVKLFIEDDPTSPMSLLIEENYFCLNNTDFKKNLFSKGKHWTPWRQVVLDLIKMGNKGVPILESVKNLEHELITASEDEIEKALQSLPFKAMLPIFVCQFPAYLFLLLGPWFIKMLQNI